MKQLKDYIRTVLDFPKKGIVFRDITSVLENPDGLKLMIEQLDHCLEGIEYESIVGPESRGFILGMPIAYLHHKSFIAVRKQGKLPGETVRMEYQLEYGTAIIEMNKDAIVPGQKVVIIDDLLATGGTTEATVRLIEKLGGEVVKLCFAMELKSLGARERLKNYHVESLIVYD